MRVWKFVTWDVKPKREDYTYEIFVKNFDKHCSASYNALRGYYREGGWQYDFRDELKRFVYKDNYGSWYEVYAPNKTAVRNSVYGRIKEIVELKR